MTIYKWQPAIPVSLISLTALLLGFVLSGMTTPAIAADEPTTTDQQIEFMRNSLDRFAVLSDEERQTPPQKSEASSAKRLQKKKLEFFQDQMRDHRLVFADQPNQPFHFVEKPLTRFDNPVSRIADGFMFLWTDRGRPVAVVKSYYNTPRETWGRTFVSLATRPIEMQIAGKKTWVPQKAGLSFAPLRDTPRPTDQPKLRLAQMRNIARKFQVIDRWGLKNPTDWRLRLLTTPLYRYRVPEEKVVDAAMFGYVLTTSPEALLLLEVHKTDDGLEWQYGVSRFTRFGITFSLGDRKVAEFPRLDRWPATGTYFHIPLALPDYPFKNNDS